MKKIVLNIFTFSIVTLTALVLLIKPELVRTMIPGIVEKVYVAINKIISIEMKDEFELKLTISIVAIIMPIFTGIMRFISDFGEGIGGDIIGAVLAPLGCIVLFCVCGVIGMLVGGFTLYMLFNVPPLFVIISYIYCFYIMTKDFKNCNCDCHESKQCCVGECY